MKPLKNTRVLYGAWMQLQSQKANLQHMAAPTKLNFLSRMNQVHTVLTLMRVLPIPKKPVCRQKAVYTVPTLSLPKAVYTVPTLSLPKAVYTVLTLSLPKAVYTVDPEELAECRQLQHRLILLLAQKAVYTVLTLSLPKAVYTVDPEELAEPLFFRQMMMTFLSDEVPPSKKNRMMVQLQKKLQRLHRKGLAHNQALLLTLPLIWIVSMTLCNLFRLS
jgi:hypothetical protein